MAIKIVALSDTHSLHSQVKIPECDILIHAGDFTGNGSMTHQQNFIDWLYDQPAKRKVVVAGNHDLFAEKYYDITKAMFAHKQITYLENQVTVIEGIKIYGSPMTPTFMNWAFMEERDKIHKYWDEIPDDTDIVVTHGPAYGILDMTYTLAGFPRDSVGCVALNKRLVDIKPKYHIFGHIHSGYGIEKIDETTYINCSVCDEQYGAVNNPVEFTYVN